MSKAIHAMFGAGFLVDPQEVRCPSWIAGCRQFISSGPAWQAATVKYTSTASNTDPSGESVRIPIRRKHVSRTKSSNQ